MVTADLRRVLGVENGPVSGLPETAMCPNFYRHFTRCFAAMWTMFRDFFRFCARESKWWLLPLVVLLLVLAGALIVATSSGIVWSLYPSSK